MGWLERMTQFKEKSAGEQRERVGSGLLTYPALMAADILLYDTNFVPVGEDQRQHIEYTRDLAQRVNQRFGAVLTLPEALIPKAGARIMGLDDPERKMSKTLAQANPGHAVFLTDPPEAIRKKFARAQTDAEPAVKFPPGPGVANLLQIYQSVSETTAEHAERTFAGKPYSELKQAVAEATIAALRPIQARYREIRSDDAQLVRDLDRAADRLAVTANATLARVQRVTGLLGHD
jgi:tryptophanyl-tRNA synthetase